MAVSNIPLWRRRKGERGGEFHRPVRPIVFGRKGALFTHALGTTDVQNEQRDGGKVWEAIGEIDAQCGF